MSSTRQAPPRARRRRSPGTVLGVVLLVLGLGCLGWVAYQYVGSNLVSRQAYRQEEDRLRAAWAQHPAGGGTTTPAPTAPADGADVPGGALGLLRVPRFGSGYEVPVLSGIGLDVLARGVGHYPSTALPGQVGNFAVAGHRVTHGEPFAKLLELDKGDQVVVETATAVYTYVVDEPPRALTVDAAASWVLDPVPGQPGARPTRALMTLTTCQDLFRSPDRSVGIAHLESTRNKS